MKFITSRIMSPTQTRSLLEILADQQQAKEVVEKKEVTASTAKPVKTAAVEKTVAKAPVAAKKAVEVKKDSKTKEYKIASIKTETKKSFPALVFKKFAKLTQKDEAFLRGIYSIYYPSDFVDAMLATY